MNATDVQQIAVGALQGLGASTVFVLALFIGFCVIVGFTKTEEDRRRRARWSSRASTSASRTARSSTCRRRRPHGPADQLKSPELDEKAAVR